MKDKQDSFLDIALYLMQEYLPHKKQITKPIKLRTYNRKVTITLGKWAMPYLKVIKNLSLFN